MPKQQIRVKDVNEAYAKWGAKFLVWDAKDYNEPTNDNKGKGKKDKASITWLRIKLKLANGNIVPFYMKFTEILSAGGAKYHEKSGDENQSITNMKMAFREMTKEEVIDAGIKPRTIEITTDQHKQVMGYAEKRYLNPKSLKRIKVALKKMFTYRHNYRSIIDAMSNDDGDIESFTEWFDGHVKKMKEKQKEENQRNQDRAAKIAANTKEFIQFSENLSVAFEALAADVIASQDELEFTVNKVGRGDPHICRIKQETVESGQGKNKKVTKLPKPLYRYSIPVHGKTGRVGRWDYKNNDLKTIVYDMRKCTLKNGSKSVPARAEDEKGRMKPLTYKTAGSFLTYGSLLTGVLGIKDISFHMFGISLGTGFSELHVFPNETPAKNGGFDVEELQQMRRNQGSDDESSSEEDLPDDSDDESGGESGDASDPFADEEKDEPAKEDLSDDSDAEPEPKAKPKKKSKKAKVSSGSDDDSDPEPKAKAKPKKKTKAKKKAKKAKSSSEEDESSENDYD